MLRGIPFHFSESLFRNGENMRIKFTHGATTVSFHLILTVDRELGVRIDGDEDNAAVGVNSIVVGEASFQVMEHCKTQTPQSVRLKMRFRTKSTAKWTNNHELKPFSTQSNNRKRSSHFR